MNYKIQPEEGDGTEEGSTAHNIMAAQPEKEGLPIHLHRSFFLLPCKVWDQFILDPWSGQTQSSTVSRGLPSGPTSGWDANTRTLILCSIPGHPAAVSGGACSTRTPRAHAPRHAQTPRAQQACFRHQPGCCWVLLGLILRPGPITAMITCLHTESFLINWWRRSKREVKWFTS